ncbi:MAG: hypothetical protein WAP74_01010 [Patescibacteria group bacterium]
MALKTELESQPERQMLSEERVLKAVETGQNGPRFNFKKYLEGFYKGFAPDAHGRWPTVGNDSHTTIAELNQRAFDDWQYVEKNQPRFGNTIKGWAAEWLILKSLAERYDGGLKFEKGTDPLTEAKGEDLRMELPFKNEKHWFRFDITVSDETQLHAKQDRAAAEAKYRTEPLETIVPLPVGKLTKDRERFIQLQHYPSLRTAFAETLVEQYIPALLVENLGPQLQARGLNAKEISNRARLIPHPARR